MNPPTLSPHGLSELFVALAFAMQQIRLIVPEASSNLRAHLFLFQGKDARQRIERLMRFIENQCPPLEKCDSSTKKSPVTEDWISRCIRCYEEHPATERNRLLENQSEYFESHSEHLSEDFLDYSVLTLTGVILGRLLYREQKDYFDALVLNIYNHRPSTSPEECLHLVFVQKSD